MEAGEWDCEQLGAWLHRHLQGEVDSIRGKVLDVCKRISGAVFMTYADTLVDDVVRQWKTSEHAAYMIQALAKALRDRERLERQVCDCHAL